MAFRSSSTSSGTGTTPSVAVPAGAAVDDIMILVASIDASGASFSGKYPTGFTALNELSLTLDGQRVSAAWKRLTGADTGTYTYTSAVGSSAAWVCQAYCFSGRDTGNPPTMTTASSNASNANPVTVTASTVTALTGDDLLWLSAPDVNATGIGNGHTPPSGYTERQDAELTFTNLSGATKDNSASGATGSVAGTFALTSGASGWAAFLLRIPAAAGGTSDTAPQGVGVGVGIPPAARAAAAQGTGAATASSPTAAALTGQGTGVGQGIVPGSIAAATPTLGTATGVGSSPAAGTSAPIGLGQGAGLAPSARSAADIGTSVGQGAAPAAASTTTSGQGVGAGLPPSARALVTQGVGTGSGIQPSDSQGAGSSDSAPQGLAHGLGISPVAATVAIVGVSSGFGVAPGASATTSVGTASGVGLMPGASISATPVPGTGTGQGRSPGVVVTVSQKIVVAAGIPPTGAQVVLGQGVGQGIGFAPTPPGFPTADGNRLESGMSSVFAEASGTARAPLEGHATATIID